MSSKPLFLEQNLYDKMIEMNEKQSTIKKWQQKRIAGSLLLVLIGAVLSLFSKENATLFLGSCIAGAIYIWWNGRQSVDNLYARYVFSRQLEFTKFCNLLIPYLEDTTREQSLYSVFNKLVRRINDKADKKNLNILMKQMTDSPSDVQPFLDFGKKMSDTTFSLIFMTTLFDIKDGNSDPDIIKRLGEMASKETLEKIEDIKELKLKKFRYYTTRIAFSCFFIILGVGFAYIYNTFIDMIQLLN